MNFIKLLFIITMVQLTISCKNGKLYRDEILCEKYYTCENNKKIEQFCLNGTVFSENKCITQSEYRNKHMVECGNCPDVDIHGDLSNFVDTRCSITTNDKCCYQYNQFSLIHCSEFTDGYFWYFANSSSLMNCKFFMRIRDLTYIPFNEIVKNHDK
jgi:hypothetical protein